MRESDGHTWDPNQAAPPPTGELPPMPTRIADRYEIVGLLGAGGMGTVYRVRDAELDEIVALKLLKRELLTSAGALERFRQEVRLARKVTHPNVVRTFDLGEHGDERFLTMEYFDGRPLAWRLGAGRLEVREAIGIVADVCEGVGAAHRAGVLHRDLKPDNILVGEPTLAGARGRVAITDFGIATARSETARGLVGTPAYMAPEQVQGLPIDARADVYALGAILFEVLTGRRAWPGEDPLAVARARLDAAPPDPRDLAPLPDAIAEIVLRCLAREPRLRLASPEDVRHALLTAAADARPDVARPTVSIPAARGAAIAVLPLRSSAADEDLAAGLAEDLTHVLSAARGLLVRPFALGTDPVDPIAAGRRLEVEVVLCGDLRRRGDLLVVNARLIGVADGFQIWGQRLECAEADLLVKADEIARAAALALQERVSPRARETADARVVALYLRGRHQYRIAYESGQLEPAQATAEAGLALAPEDPSLLALHAMICARAAFYARDPGDPRLALGFASARRAVAAAPGSGEVWLANATMALVGGDGPEAARSLRLALKHAPGLARAQGLLGGLLIDVGRLEEAVARLDAAVALDPNALFVRTDLARAYAYLGRWEQVVKLVPPSPDPVLHYISAQYRCRFATWSPDAPPGFAADDATGPFRGDHPAIAISRALFAIGQGGIDDAGDRAAGDAMYRAHGRLRATVGQFLAESRAATGRLDGALEAIRVAVASGLQDQQWMDGCGALAPVRGLPAFATLREAVAARAEAIRRAIDSAS